MDRVRKICIAALSRSQEKRPGWIVQAGRKEAGYPTHSNTMLAKPIDLAQWHEEVEIGLFS